MPDPSRQPSDRHDGYLVSGASFVVLSLPAWFFLLAGRLMDGRDPYLFLSLFWAPLGILLIVFGLGKLARNSKSGIGVRIATMGLSFAVFMYGSKLGVKLGVESLGTSVVFCAMASSYLSLVAFVFLIAALAQRSAQNE